MHFGETIVKPIGEAGSQAHNQHYRAMGEHWVLENPHKTFILDCENQRLGVLACWFKLIFLCVRALTKSDCSRGFREFSLSFLNYRNCGMKGTTCQNRVCEHA